VLARSTGVDLTTGRELDGRLAGASVVIDVSNLQTTSTKKSIAFFGKATSSLLAAEERAGIAHHVALSVVGCDRVGFGYYLGKRRQEELVLSGRVPATVLRATQFHEFAAQLLARGGPIALVPQMLSQPIAAREVADMLAGISREKPAGLVPDLAGPRVYSVPELLRGYLRATGKRRLMVPVRLPGQAARAVRAGANLAPERAVGRRTWEDFLAERVPQTARSSAAARPRRSVR